jgi:hypothetical protein
VENCLLTIFRAFAAYPSLQVVVSARRLVLPGIDRALVSDGFSPSETQDLHQAWHAEFGSVAADGDEKRREAADAVLTLLLARICSAAAAALTPLVDADTDSTTPEIDALAPHSHLPRGPLPATLAGALLELAVATSMLRATKPTRLSASLSAALRARAADHLALAVRAAYQPDPRVALAAAFGSLPLLPPKDDALPPLVIDAVRLCMASTSLDRVSGSLMLVSEAMTGAKSNGLRMSVARLIGALVAQAPADMLEDATVHATAASMYQSLETWSASHHLGLKGACLHAMTAIVVRAPAAFYARVGMTHLKRLLKGMRKVDKRGNCLVRDCVSIRYIFQKKKPVLTDLIEPQSCMELFLRAGRPTAALYDLSPGTPLPVETATLTSPPLSLGSGPATPSRAVTAAPLSSASLPRIAGDMIPPPPSPARPLSSASATASAATWWRAEDTSAAVQERLQLIHAAVFATPPPKAGDITELLVRVVLAMAAHSLPFVGTTVLPALLSDRHGSRAAQAAGLRALHRLLLSLPPHARSYDSSLSFIFSRSLWWLTCRT